MTTVYYIRQKDDQPQDGEVFAQWDKMLSSLAYAEEDAQVWALSFKTREMVEMTKDAARALQSQADFYNAVDRPFLSHHFPRRWTDEECEAAYYEDRRASA